MKVFAYLRVSTKEQLDGGGFERQQDAVAKLASFHGWTVARWFRDQQSGATEFDDRKGLQEILALAGECNSIGIDTVLVENSSRIARDLMVQEIFLAECRKRGIKVITADSGEEIVFTVGDPTRKLMRQIMGALAEWEKATLVLKLQAGRRAKARKTGEPCGGPKPYGQTQAERAVIADIVKLRKGGMSFQKICAELRQIGYPTPNGDLLWTSSTVHKIYHREIELRDAETRWSIDNDDL